MLFSKDHLKPGISFSVFPKYQTDLDLISYHVYFPLVNEKAIAVDPLLPYRLIVV